MRLATDFWVRAYIARLGALHIPVYVIRHGQDTSGDVVVKLIDLKGGAKLFAQRYDFTTDSRSWEVVYEGDEAQAQNWAMRQAQRDPDLWILEVEDCAGRHLLDEM